MPGDLAKALRWTSLAMALALILVMAHVITGIVKNVAVIACIAKAGEVEAMERACGVALTILTLERSTIRITGDDNAR